MAMQLAADYFGAGQTLFLTNGATGGILAMLTGLAGRQRRIILPRTCHLSIANAIALLDLQPVWLEFPADAAIPQPFALLPEITPEVVAKAIAAHPDSIAVVLTYPDYYGRCADLAAIARITHEAGMLLLVDEAHGAHFAAAPDLLPPTALAAGADACVQSAHKTLPALTQGAYLHLSAHLMAIAPEAAERVRAALRIFQTSSPSFAIAASLDFARDYLNRQGHTRIEQLISEINQLAGPLQDDWLVSPPTRLTEKGLLRDPARIVIRCPREVGPATIVAARLSEAGIDVEMADLSRLVLIPALDQPHRDFVRLAAALESISGQLKKTAKLSQADQVNQSKKGSQVCLAALEADWLRLLVAAPEQVLTPGEALLGSHQTEWIPLEAAAGRIAAAPLSPYPPGIPLLLPGERIDAARLDLLLRLRDNKITIAGVDSKLVRVVV